MLLDWLRDFLQRLFSFRGALSEASDAEHNARPQAPLAEDRPNPLMQPGRGCAVEVDRHFTCGGVAFFVSEFRHPVEGRREFVGEVAAVERRRGRTFRREVNGNPRGPFRQRFGGKVGARGLGGDAKRKQDLLAQVV